MTFDYCILIFFVMSKKWTLLILFIAGLIILWLPDSGKRIVELNKNHGPSIQDLIGLALMLISWLLSCEIVIRNRKEIKLKTGNKNFERLIIIYLLSLAGIVLSLALSSDFFLWVSVAAGALINALFIIYAFNKK